MDELVSVIVPVYNVDKYLKKCVNSIINQTYKNLEIILVDDGSSDRSGALCDCLAEKDNRIRVIHKENGGVSTARNEGIIASSGKYVTFVDADDWLPLNAVQLLLKDAVDKHSDFVMGSAILVGVVKEAYCGVNNGIVVRMDKNDELIDYTNILRTELGPWAKLFKSDILKNNGVTFPLGIAYGEDRIFIWEYLKYCQRLSAIPNHVYYYSQINMDSAIRKFYPDINKWLSKSVKCFSEIYTCKDTIVRQNICGEISSLFRFCCTHYCEQQNNDIEKTEEYLLSTIQCFEDVLNTVLKDENVYQDSTFSTCDREIHLILNKDIKGICADYTSISRKGRLTFLRKEIKKIFVNIKQYYVYSILRNRQ